MKFRRVGDSSIICSVLGFGTWEMGATQYGAIDLHEAVAAVHFALDHGITLIDTAESYGPWHAETVLGKALGARRKDVVLVTKVGLVFDEKGKLLGLDASRDRILSATERCLNRLGTDWLDLLLIHWPDHKTPHEETIGALEDLRRAGKIREYGVSNYTVEMIEQCERFGHLAANQIGYHMFDRRVESRLLPYCAGHHIGFMTYGTLAFGLLAGAFTPETIFPANDWRSRGEAFGLPLFEREHFLRCLRVVDRLKRLAQRYGKTVAQLAIAWVLSNPSVSVALVGARKPSEVEENMAAADWALDDNIRSEIDRIFVEEKAPTYRDAEPITVPPPLRATSLKGGDSPTR